MAAVTVATNMAGRGTDIKLGGHDATDKQFEDVTKTGGLHIIGSERHEARRIDNQLRGRSGRQGEPGSSRFYVALDDEIMRIQGGPIVQRIMEMTNIPDDMPIEAGMISKAIETAQKRMEGANFDVRKQLVEYDDVANKQREIYYSKRRNILSLEEKQKIADMISELLVSEVEWIVNKHFIPERKDDIDIKQLSADYADLADDDLIAKAINVVHKKAVKGTEVRSFIEKELGGKKPEFGFEYLTSIMKEVINLKIKDYGKDLGPVVRNYYLESMDQGWTEHLDAMTDLRQGIGLRGYAQRDPLVEYKNEGFGLFESFMASVDSSFTRAILKIKRVEERQVGLDVNTNAKQIEDVLTGTREMDLPANNKVKPSDVSGIIRKASQTSVKTSQKVGRNDPCPCGSGLKYKKCGLINSPKHRTS